MEPDAYNPQGYWESNEIRILNDAILESAGSMWDDWEPFNPNWISTPIANAFSERARATLTLEYGDSRLFLFKDPRVCRLLDFWVETFESMAITPLIVLPIRNPKEIASSLMERDRIDPSIGLLLWLRHILDAEHSSRGCLRAVVHYEDVLDNWQASVQRMSERLGVFWPKSSTATDLEIEGHLKLSARHHQVEDTRLLEDPAASKWIKTAYEIMTRWARDDMCVSDEAELDHIRGDFDNLVSLFGRPVAIGRDFARKAFVLESEKGVLKDAAAGLERQIEAAREAIADRDGRLDELGRAVADRDGRLGSMEDAAAGLERQIEAAREAIADRDGRLDELGRAVADRDGRLGSMEDAAAGLERQIEAAREAIADRDGRLDELGRAVADRDGRLGSMEDAAAGLERQIEAAREAIADRDGRLDELGRAVADRDGRLGSMEDAAAGLERQIEAAREAIADRDGRLDELGRAVADRDGRLGSMEDAAAGLERQIEAAREAIADRDGRLDELGRAVADRDGRLGSMEDAAAGLERQIEAAREAIADRDGRLDELGRAVADRDGRLQAVYASTSWRITAPVRVAKPALLAPYRLCGLLLRGVIVHPVRFVWRHLPIDLSIKKRWKAKVYSFFASAQVAETNAGEDNQLAIYTHSNRIELPDRNLESSKSGEGIPIFFDPEYYMSVNNDLRDSDIDPLAHYLEYGAVEGRMPIDTEKSDIDPLILKLHRLDIQQEDAISFDSDFYRILYSDVQSMEDVDLENHYLKYGQAEGRIGSPGEFVRQICKNPREIPIDFKPSEYIGLYPDLQVFADKSPLEALRHYMCFGRWEPRLYTLRTDRIAEEKPVQKIDINIPDQLKPKAPALCVLVHLYYPELWPALTQYINNLPEHIFDLYINLVDTTFTPDVINEIRDQYPNSRIYISENKGRDIGGHINLMRNIRTGDYSIFCLLHSKKSPHMGKAGAEIWRRKLLVPLLGNREIAMENINMMLSDESVGLIGSSECRYTELNDNADKYYQLLDMLEIGDDSRGVDFVSGTMMFLRSGVMWRLFESIKDLPFENGDNKSSNFHYDGQWEHALERVFGNVVRDMGYRIEWR